MPFLSPYSADKYNCLPFSLVRFPCEKNNLSNRIRKFMIHKRVSFLLSQQLLLEAAAAAAQVALHTNEI